MSKSMLEHYLQVGEASVGAYLLTPGGSYRQVDDHPAADLIWDADHRVFGWWWAYSERPHAFRITKIEEEGDFVTLYHVHGKIVLSPIYLMSRRDERLYEQWKRRDRSYIQELLRIHVERVAGGPPDEPLPREEPRVFQTMLEMVPSRSDPGRWVVIGAWAADEGEIAYWPFPEYVVQGSAIQENIARARSQGTAPLEIFQFWYEEANGVSVMRSLAPPVEAPSAEAAAEIAARRGREGG
ncbi:MAG: hypothetical protein J7M34_05055 [Anaerolineae bacterium]|nr:hypothetical protein [Anaerolineae bacterium]